MDSEFDVHERRMFEMYFVEGYSANEMAELERVSEDNLMVQMYQLRKKLLNKV